MAAIDDRSVYKKFLNCVQAQVESMLQELGVSLIVVQTQNVDEDGVPQEGVRLIWDKEQDGEGTTCSDDYGYPVVVRIITGEDKNWGITDGPTLLRQKIKRTFHNKRVVGFEDDDAVNIVCKVSYGDVSVDESFANNWSEGRMVITGWFRETRNV